MKRHYMIIMLILVTQVISSGQEVSYNPKDWPRYTLKLSSEGTLKDIFDSGIRPFRIPGSENSELRFKHSKLLVQSPEGMLFPEVQVEYSELQVKPSGLWKMTTTSPRVTLEEAKKQMLEWLPIINKTEDKLDSFLSIVSDNFLNYDDRDFGKAADGFYGSWRGKNKENYTVWLAKGYNAKTPLRICFRVYWLKSRGMNKSGTFYQGPIPPPAGYENVSMEAPEKWGPDSMADIRKWRGEDIGDGTGSEFKMRPLGWEPRQEDTLPPPKREPKPKIAEEKTTELQKKSSLPWIITGVLLLGIPLLLLKIFKGKSTC